MHYLDYKMIGFKWCYSIGTSVKIMIVYYKMKIVNIQNKSNVKEDEKRDPSEWLKFENKYWGLYQFPYLSDIKSKLTNCEIYAIIKSEVKVCDRVLQACRENSIIVISSNCLKNVEDIKSDLNAVFGICHKAKSKKVQVNDTIVMGKPNSDKQIVEGELVMKINRHKNEHGLVRNIVYFLNEKKEVLNSKIVLQYYIINFW